MNVAKVMAKVRAEVARRRAVDAAPGNTADLDLPDWHPAAARLQEKSQYLLNELLRFDDADFIEVAYRVLLRRAADDQGSHEYLDALRGGRISKVEILGLIRFSGEGRRNSVHVDGLLLPYKLHRWRHIRIVGWLLGMAMAIVRLPRLAWRLQGMEASAARESQELGRLLNHVEAATVRQLAELDGAINVMRAELVRSVTEQVEALREQLPSLRDEVGLLTETLHASDADRAARQQETADRLAAHDIGLARLDERTRTDQRTLRATLDRLTVFLDVVSRQGTGNTSPKAAEAVLETQYASFEQMFRGEREQIKQRVAHYLGTLAAAGIKPGDENVILDLGSGRGEWLEVLREHGYHGRGVDLNRGMLKASEARGHEVVEANALDYLHAQDGNAFAAVTSMHLIEHIPHPALIQLLDETLRTLRPGGVLILETPNPENVLVGSCTFYFDPTHLNPIPPMMLQWLVQSRGFDSVVIERLSEHRGEPALQPVATDVPGSAQINQMVAWFTAAPDYAVIARKPPNWKPAA